MSDTMAQVDDFCRYAERRVVAGEKGTIVELFHEWLRDRRSDVERDADPRAVDPALRDANMGNLSGGFTGSDRVSDIGNDSQ
ncbi:MAG TPA: hypothetical protein VGN57_04795 [Pirellulaceae bacterium]|jgi:hypothetical protein|nr:hypothetical protein [Pirellulaceae bacterium]